MYTNNVTTASDLDFDEFLSGITGTIRHWQNDQAGKLQTPAEKRMPAALLDVIMKKQPTSVSIPKQFGGRGGSIKESMRLLSATSYESLEMSMMFGINLFLFLQPVAKYAREDVKAAIFPRLLEDGQMGGFMLTEPDFGSDVLNLATCHFETGTHYCISGTKHWQGLTGYAKYWLVASRRKNSSGELAPDIDFFISDGNQMEQQIEVLEYYDSLGLYMLPYGLNKIDISVPKSQKLESGSNGIKVMQDILHNSRLQFPGMVMGFIQRTLDEAITHCKKRHVGGKNLLAYDNVQYQISRVQAAYTICSAMCVRTCAINGIEHDVSQMGLEANTMKALVTDLMHESAQILSQLSGSKGYRLSEFAGRALIDSRPFQIFEGPNDMLYNQIADTILRGMKITREQNVMAYLMQNPLMCESSQLFKDELNFTVNFSLSQRKKIAFGKIIAQVVSAGYVLELGNRGYRKDLLDSAILVLRQDCTALFSIFQSNCNSLPVVDYKERSNWFEFLG